MAFLSKVGNMLRQTTSKQISNELSASRPSIYQAIRCMSSSKVFVGGISYATDDTSLREAFSKYGEVIEARVILDRETGRSRGFGFVTYTSSEEASSAIQALDGQDLQGRRVRVNYANDRARGSFGGYGGGSYGAGGGSYGGGGYGAAGGGYGGGGYGAGGGGYGAGAGGYGAGGGGYSSNYASPGGNYGAGNTSGGSDYANADVTPGGNTFDSSSTAASGGGWNYGAFGGSVAGENTNEDGVGSGNFGSSNKGGGDDQFFGHGGSSFDDAGAGYDQAEPLEGRDDDDSDFAKRA